MRLGTRELLSILALGGAFGGCDDTLLDPMMNDQKYKPYEENGFFADGRAMREPPPGTVPRERRLGSRAETTGRVAGEGSPFVTSFPVKITPELIAKGRKRFDITCATCHGLLGDGDSLVGKKMSLKPPPSLHLRSEPGYFFEIVSKGHGMMASYAAEIPLEERWGVVAYVRALQISQRSHIGEVPEDVRARFGEGRP